MLKENHALRSSQQMTINQQTQSEKYWKEHLDLLEIGCRMETQVPPNVRLFEQIDEAYIR